MASKHDPTKKREIPHVVAVTPDRSLAPLGAYVSVKRLAKTDKGIWLAKGTRGIICADKKSRIKHQGQVAFKVPGHDGYYVVAMETLEILRPE